MSNKSIKIQRRFTSLRDAVNFVNPDLSYNQEIADEYISRVDGKCTTSIVTEGGEIYYIFDADIRLLHKFSPFVAVISTAPFVLAFIVGSILSIGDQKIPKTPEGRAFFKSNKLGALAFCE